MKRLKHQTQKDIGRRPTPTRDTEKPFKIKEVKLWKEGSI